MKATDARLETLDILSAPDEMQAVHEGLDAIERGETYSAADVRLAMPGRPA